MNRLLILLAIAAPDSGAVLTERVFSDLHDYGFAREKDGPIGEALDERDARYRDIALAIDAACRAHPWPGWPHKACVAMATTAAKWESGMLRTVHEGSKVGAAGEKCLFQLHRKTTLAPLNKWHIAMTEWEQLTGLGPEATARCADAGVRVLGWQVARCRIKFARGDRWPAAQVFGEYHFPSATCDAPPGAMGFARAGSFVSLYEKLVRK